MKKLILGLFVTLTALSAYGQKPAEEPSVLITRNTSTQRMVWSDVQDEWMFFDLTERHSDNNVWLSYFNDNGSGYMKMIRVSNNEEFAFTIYDYEMRENDRGQYLWIDALQIHDGQKVTVLVQEYGEGIKMVTIFMPKSNVVLYFDTEQF